MSRSSSCLWPLFFSPQRTQAAGLSYQEHLREENHPPEQLAPQISILFATALPQQGEQERVIKVKEFHSHFWGKCDAVSLVSLP